MVHQVQDVTGQFLTFIGGCVMGSGALAMAALVQGNAAEPATFKGPEPARAAPAFLAVGGIAMDQQDGTLIALGRDVVIGQLKAIRNKGRNNQFPSPMGSEWPGSL